MFAKRDMRSSPRGSPGTSLMEMVVVLAIMGVLSALAVPYASKIIAREKEMALRATLREVRTAIDRFHADWAAAKGGAGFSAAASPDGYPLTFEALVEGVDTGGIRGTRQRYLRSIPRNPFSPPAAAIEQQWRLISYQDGGRSGGRRGQDIYDLRANTGGIALDGTSYAEW